MRSALYYPHTTVKNESILKTALLLWDKLEYLAPGPEFRASYGDRLWNETFEIIGQPHVPSPEEKRASHRAIESLASKRLPDWFYHHSSDQPYLMYPEKLLPETWEILQHSRLVSEKRIYGDAVSSWPVGLIVMALLADTCAGQTKSRITDQSDSYAYLLRWLTLQEHGLFGDRAHGAPGARGHAHHERLATITIRIMNTDELTLRQLVAFRKKEAAQDGHLFRDLRHRYLDRLEVEVEKIRTTKLSSESDRAELERQFAEEMTDDYNFLADSLEVEQKSVLFSKEMAVAVVSGVGTLASLFAPIAYDPVTLSGAILSVGGLLGVLNKFKGGRNKVLREHPMAYLYQLTSRLRA